MIKQVLHNIELSDICEEEKKELIHYAEQLYSIHCPVIFDVDQLLLLFEIKGDELENFVTDNTNRYFIRKKSGESREVWKPNCKLKSIQKWILKNILNNIEVSNCSHGFVKNKSILTNAQVHLHQEPFWVFSTDIKSFFPSIKKKEIKKIFVEIGYSESVSEALCLLTTANGILPQGFPTSPSISNIFFRKIDEEFQQVASRYSIRYSRYVDDITFSGIQNNRSLSLVKKLKQIISYTLSRYNLNINEKKTRLMKNKHTKIVTGLIVTSQGVRIPQKYIRRINKEIYYCQKFGVNEHLKYHGLITIANYKGYLVGLARFIYMVDSVKGAELIKKIQDLEWN
ncbi:reverse transcriptase family protein [Bacillus sp. CNPSo 3703]|uniref:reverse transcriptase family protein n=1 Tax=Bacillus altitudinis TaxID=293387 RepID=UPI00237B4DF2|nr:reverse transcriptase family protein [Bacillus altitudinis]MDE0639739.1 reverse transcriptase family protein [Bacillus altitudinis]MED4562276.1 reverse transcriptase family protein [Bacillus altitudinis]